MRATAKKSHDSLFHKAVDVFRRHGGILRASQAIRVGIHPATLYAMRDAGVIELLSRGVYRLTELPPPENPDLITVAIRIPKGVICLVSALAFHDLTAQIPHRVDIALPPGAEEPRIEYPPVKTYRFSWKSYSEGVEVHVIDGVPVRVYSPEKTIADCFKFRNRIGKDVVIEALRAYRDRGNIRVDTLMRFASICRVANVMRPYLEAIL